MTPPRRSPARFTVRVETDGGFAFLPGLNRPFELDSAQLEPADATAWDAALAGLGFYDRSAPSASPAPGAADYRTYTITVEHGGESHTVRLAEPIQDPTMRELVERLLAWHRGR